MKTDIKLIALTFLCLTALADAKSTPLKSKIDVNPYIKEYDKKVKVEPVDLIKPASISYNDDIDYRELFSLLIRLSL